VKRPDGVFRQVWTVLLYVRTVILAVRTIQLIHSDVNSSSSDERVFAISTWHYVWTSLKFVRTVNPVGLNRILPTPQPSYSPFFGSFLSSRAFSLCFLCVTL